jgi:hypothetical protein
VVSNVAEDADLFGIDLKRENERLRAQNGKLAVAISLAVIGGLIAIAVGAVGMFSRPERERIGLDASGRAIPLVSLTKNDPPDAKITRMVGDCMNELFNHAFHNYQTTVQRAIGDCFTGGGSDSVRKMMEPFLARMKKEDVNLAGTFVIQPFINNRGTTSSGGIARNAFYVQGVLSIGYRGGKGGVKPVEYAFQSDVVRVSYDSHPDGIRLQNVVMAPWEGQR